MAEVGDWPSSCAAVLNGPAWLTVKSKAELAGVARQRFAPVALALLLAADLSDRLAVALSMAMVVVHLFWRVVALKSELARFQAKVIC